MTVEGRIKKGPAKKAEIKKEEDRERGIGRKTEREIKSEIMGETKGVHPTHKQPLKGRREEIQLRDDIFRFGPESTQPPSTM